MKDLNCRTTQVFQLNKIRFAWTAMKLLFVISSVLIALYYVAGCSGKSTEPIVVDLSEDPWMKGEATCIRQSSEGPLRRVINRTDPELCGRRMKHRPPDHVRIILPPSP